MPEEHGGSDNGGKLPREAMEAKVAMMVHSRDDIPELLTALNLRGAGVEVGVCLGEYSEKILAGSRLCRLYSVDSWAWEERGLPTDSPYDAMLQALARLRRFGHRSVVLRMDSLDAACIFRLGALDFVYIDAKHDYDSVKADIAAWFPLIRYGGVLAGHDYEVWHDWPHVRRAVDEFVAMMGLDLTVTAGDGVDNGIQRHSWLVQKV